MSIYIKRDLFEWGLEFFTLNHRNSLNRILKFEDWFQDNFCIYTKHISVLFNKTCRSIASHTPDKLELIFELSFEPTFFKQVFQDFHIIMKEAQKSYQVIVLGQPYWVSYQNLWFKKGRFSHSTSIQELISS